LCIDLRSTIHSFFVHCVFLSLSGATDLARLINELDIEPVNQAASPARALVRANQNAILDTLYNSLNIAIRRSFTDVATFTANHLAALATRFIARQSRNAATALIQTLSSLSATQTRQFLQDLFQEVENFYQDNQRFLSLDQQSVPTKATPTISIPPIGGKKRGKPLKRKKPAARIVRRRPLPRHV